MATATDASMLIWDFLKTNELAADLRALVHSGATNVLESGDITEAILEAAVADRRDAGEQTKVLAIAVQDAGERPVPRMPGHFMQFVVVRLYDRDRGYRNIRNTRIELMSILRPSKFRQNLAAGLGKGILTMSYNDRTGHRWDPVHAIEYEAASFTFHVVKKED
jgi:hypothetical protein